MESAFSFPYAPYPQQLQLMEAIKLCIDQERVGCLESPTGSGKTLSVICAVLTWLVAEQDRILQPAPGAAKTAGAAAAQEDWLEALLRQSSAGSTSTTADGSPTPQPLSSTSSSRYDQAAARDQYKRVKTLIANAKIAKSNSRHDFPKNLSSRSQTTALSTSTADDEFLLAHYDSDKDAHGEGEEGDEEEINFKSALQLPQLFYCSRTHSQVSQFVNEIKKTRFHSRVQCAVLASRRHMCINASVSALPHEQAINDKCKDMNKSSAQPTADGKKSKTSAVDTRCPYHNRSRESTLSYLLAQEIRDLEDLVSLGRDQATCPYYASKQAVAHSQVICMPYSTLLHHEVRASYNLEITKNTVVVIDEAHNLIDAINAIYSAEIRASTLSVAFQAIVAYTSKYRSRLSGKNVYYLTVLTTVVKKIRDHLTQAPSTGQLTINDFLFACGLDHINLFKLQRYLRTSQLANKIGGFADRSAQPATPTTSTSPTIARSALRAVMQFLFCLTNQEGDGRLFYTTDHSPASSAGNPKSASVRSDATAKDSVGTAVKADPEKGASEIVFKYVMLNPGRYFQVLLEQARAVILLGGTLQPFATITHTLLASVSSAKMHLFSCGHVISPDQIKPIVLGRVEDKPLEVTFTSRLSISTTDAIYSALLALVQAIPAGVVVFFTSYQYMHTLLSRWKSDGKLQALHSQKPVFVETTPNHSVPDWEDAESGSSVWERYQQAVRHGSSQGALLCSVMGGRLSEGINFSDNLARGVVIVGMPFPDPRDAILQEKLKYSLSQQRSESGSSPLSMQDLYEAMCMKVVNQSIGRSIRHVRDYASIVLLDHRYEQGRVQGLLPGWIRESVRTMGSLHAATDELQRFFSSRPG